MCLPKCKLYSVKLALRSTYYTFNNDCCSNFLLLFFFFQWCEEHPYCTNRLKLTDFLVKPMQRVTKYPLLVRAIYNKTIDDEEKDHLTRMVNTIKLFI